MQFAQYYLVILENLILVLFDQHQRQLNLQINPLLSFRNKSISYTDSSPIDSFTSFIKSESALNWLLSGII
jgi:hypothetical protein